MLEIVKQHPLQASIAKLFPEQRINELTPITERGLSNTKFRCTLVDGSTHLVRVNERLPTEVGLSRFRKAQFCSRVAASVGMPVPQVSQFGTLDNEKPYSIENWVDGGVPADTVVDEDKRVAIWKNIVAEARKLISADLLGKEALYSFGFNGDSPTETWEQHCDKVLQALERDTQLDFSPKEKDQLASALCSFDLSKYPPCLCHGDLKLDNVLVEPDTLKVIAIVDWEIARLAPSVVGELATTIEPAVLDIKKNAVPKSAAERQAILAAFGGDQEQLQRDFALFFAADVIMNLDDYATVLAEGSRPDLATMQERLSNYLRGLQPDIENLKRFLAENEGR